MSFSSHLFGSESSEHNIGYSRYATSTCSRRLRKREKQNVAGTSANSTTNLFQQETSPGVVGGGSVPNNVYQQQQRGILKAQQHALVILQELHQLLTPANRALTPLIQPRVPAAPTAASNPALASHLIPATQQQQQRSHHQQQQQLLGLLQTMNPNIALYTYQNYLQQSQKDGNQLNGGNIQNSSNLLLNPLPLGQNLTISEEHGQLLIENPIRQKKTGNGSSKPLLTGRQFDATVVNHQPSPLLNSANQTPLTLQQPHVPLPPTTASNPDLAALANQLLILAAQQQKQPSQKAPNCLAPKDLTATERFSFEDECIRGQEMERSLSKSDVIELMKQQLSILQSRFGDERIQGKELERSPSKADVIELMKQQLSILQSRYISKNQMNIHH